MGYIISSMMASLVGFVGWGVVLIAVVVLWMFHDVIKEALHCLFNGILGLIKGDW